ncbi:hypothetical protein LU699_11040 [Luteimonas fraxinea]|uniref:hypothetical protein n=1 Tax=Luteimonas fraxinea TaxID=2901869 RepID=UPI001E2ED6CB|nr:hypothetical protein [Luteimonas fraxinea]UHH08846.1 hypothetical protein LU699_11040 [Luteimonas fraxinea]
MNATGRRRIRNSIANFIAGLAAIASPTLSAQESDQVFTVYDYENRLIGEYKTQAEAESAIREIPGPFEFFSDIFSYAREIKETIHTEDGKVRIVYWLGLDQPTDLEWRYPMADQYFDNEADALQEQIAITNSNFRIAQYQLPFSLVDGKRPGTTVILAESAKYGRTALLIFGETIAAQK